MGKASRWFRGLLGLKKPDTTSPSQTAPKPPGRSDPKPPKRRWSFVKSYREKDHPRTQVGVNGRSANADDNDDDNGSVDPSRHAIAVAAATAAVADAAVAAAQAAAAVVRLTSSGRSTASGSASTAAYVSSTGFGIREQWAAIKIQSNFRAYLSRRALRALKALVKLQALVRGHIVRKQTEDVQQRLQALLRAQARARAGRARISESSHSSTKSSHFHHPGPATPEKFEYAIRAKSNKHDQLPMLKRNSSKSNGRMVIDQEKALLDCRTDDEKSDKILEIDTGKPQFTPKRRNLFRSSHHPSASDQNSHSLTTSKETVPSPSSCEVQSLSPLEFTPDAEATSFCTADNSPQFYSVSSKGGRSTRGLSFTPTKSDGSRSCLSGDSEHPNFMSYTESSKAKMRSLSAPRQRPQYEKSSATNRYSVYGYGDWRCSSRQRVSTLQANFTSKAYPGSGRLDRLGMPVGGDPGGFSGGNWSRY